MKKIFIITILSILSAVPFCFAQEGPARGGSLKWTPSTPDAISKKANSKEGVTSPYSGILQDPMINSTIGGMGNMLQGVSGSAYDAQEQTKRQLDYTKQQMKYSD